MDSFGPERLAKVLDLLLDAVCIVDVDGRFVGISGAGERIFGYPVPEMLGRPMIDFVHPADRARTLAAVDEIVAGRPQPHFENRYVRKNGSVVHIMWSARWSEPDQLRVAVARDVTALKQAQAMQSVLYAIAEAAYASDDLAHLFRRTHAILVELLPAAGFGVALLDTAGQHLHFTYHAGHGTAPDASFMQLLCEEVAQRATPLLLPAGTTTWSVESETRSLALPRASHCFVAWRSSIMKPRSAWLSSSQRASSSVRALCACIRTDSVSRPLATIQALNGGAALGGYTNTAEGKVKTTATTRRLEDINDIFANEANNVTMADPVMTWPRYTGGVRRRCKQRGGDFHGDYPGGGGPRAMVRGERRMQLVPMTVRRAIALGVLLEHPRRHQRSNARQCSPRLRQRSLLLHGRFQSRRFRCRGSRNGWTFSSSGDSVPHPDQQSLFTICRGEDRSQLDAQCIGRFRSRHSQRIAHG